MHLILKPCWLLQVSTKEKLLGQSRSQHAGSISDRDLLRIELGRLGVTFRDKQVAVDEQIAEVSLSFRGRGGRIKQDKGYELAGLYPKFIPHYGRYIYAVINNNFHILLPTGGQAQCHHQLNRESHAEAA